MNEKYLISHVFIFILPVFSQEEDLTEKISSSSKSQKKKHN